MRNQDKGKTLQHKKTRDTISSASESNPEEFQDTGTDSHNMVDGVNSPTPSSAANDGESNSETESSVEQEVDKEMEKNVNDQASTGIGYTTPTVQRMNELQSLTETLMKEIKQLKSERNMSNASTVTGKTPGPRDYYDYSQLFVNRVGKNYTFNGEEEDPQERVDKYTEFRSKIEFALNSHPILEPQLQEPAIREALFSILKGSAFSDFQPMAKQGLTIKQVLSAMDKIYGYRTDLPMLMKQTYDLPIYDDRCVDNTYLSKTMGTWLKIEELTEGWSAKRFIFELMKGHILGTESNRIVSSFTISKVREFYDEMYEFDRQRNLNVANPNTPLGIRYNTAVLEVNAFNTGPGKKVEKKRTWKKPRTRPPKSYERIWKALSSKKHIKNSEANKNIAKERFDKDCCLYCGKEGHSGFTCTATKGESGYFRDSS